MNTVYLLAPLLALIGTLAGPLAPTAAALPAQDQVPDIQDETDRSIRWLRSTQDRQSGAYGGGVAGTAWVLRALHHAPRKYVAEDGFFVRGGLDFLLGAQGEDGRIADPQSDVRATRHQSQLAAIAIFDYLSEANRSNYARAVAFLEQEQLGEGPYPGVFNAGPDYEAVLARTQKLLSQRQADGSWEGSEGAVIETAKAVLELSAYAKILKPKTAPALGAKPLPAFDEADRAEVLASLERGANFLLGVAEDGKWGAPGQADLGLTAMCIAALQNLPQPRRPAVQAVIDGGLAWILEHRQSNGGIHQGRLANYVTSASVMALAAAQNEEYTAALLGAREFLIGLQADEGEGYSEGDRYYGGIGYGGDERPDLSNLQMALDALAATGLESNHEAYQRSLKFLERCQNRSESNDVEIIEGEFIITAGDDGGGQYMPGNSKAGYVVDADGNKVPRSYGSMTYALLKGFVLAGLDKEDQRVQAAWRWIQRNYTLDINPGFDTSSDPRAGYQGLFYYFVSMARALNLFDTDVIVDAAGKEHAWRRQLAGRLVGMQSREDGSWVNENAPRWWEGNPVLATAYAMTALAETME